MIVEKLTSNREVARVDSSNASSSILRSFLFILIPKNWLLSEAFMPVNGIQNDAFVDEFSNRWYIFHVILPVPECVSFKTENSATWVDGLINWYSWFAEHMVGITQLPSHLWKHQYGWTKEKHLRYSDQFGFGCDDLDNYEPICFQELVSTIDHVDFELIRYIDLQWASQNGQRGVRCLTLIVLKDGLILYK